VVRSGIASLLKATEDIVVAGEEVTVREAVEEADRTPGYRGDGRALG
jgi:hypothetical protein